MSEPFYDRGIEFEFREGAEEQGDFVPSGKLVTTIREHLLAGELEAATKVYQSCSHDLGAELIAGLRMESSSLVRTLGRMFTEARDFKRAAKCYEHLGDATRAARLYEQANQFPEAAACHVAAKEPGLAAQMFLRAGMPAEAAKLLEAAGDLVHAAEAHEMNGDFLAAGRAYAKVGQEARAIALLQRVEVASPTYPEARLLLGTVLARVGSLEHAARAFAEAVLRTPMSPQYAAEIWFRLGHVYVKMGDQARARFAYEKVHSIAPGYRDAEQRIAALGAVPAAAPGAAPRPMKAAPRVAAAPPRVPGSIAPPAEAAAAAEVGVAGPGQVVSLLEGFEHLKALPMARDLSLDDLRLLYAQCEHSNHPTGSALIEQGRPGEALYIVRKGKLQVRVGGKPVAELGEGACVGEMSMVDEGATSATVVAMTDVSAFRLSKDRFQRLLKTHAPIALSVYRVFVETLVARLRTANEKMQQAS